MSKKAFLGNEANKQALINLLAGELLKEGVDVKHADGDADFTICKMACCFSTERPTAVVAEDSDVFQLMTHHANSQDFNLYMVTAIEGYCVYHNLEEEAGSINIRRSSLYARRQRM